MILAEKIVKLRKEQGWSQEELAVRLNVSRQSVSKWESMASMPDLDKILNMSELFGVNTDYLLKDEAPERALHRLLLVPCAGHLPGRKFYNPLLGLHLDHLACGGGAVCCGWAGLYPSGKRWLLSAPMARRNC